MTKKRIVITGMGVVSCLGNEVESFYEALLQGKSGVSTITGFSTDQLTTKFAAEIKEFDAGDYIDRKQARRVDRSIAYALVAGKKALEQGKLTGEALKQLDATKAGVLIGSGMGGMGVFCEGVRSLEAKGGRGVSPFFVPYILSNMAGALLGIDVGFMGPNYSVATACATGNYALIAAAEHIRKGEADVMLCGGTEAPILPMAIAGFNACKALSQRNDAPEKASRPWDKDRDGFVLGEGAGVLILESLEHALKRGAPIIAEYFGGGVSCDAYHMTEPRTDGKGVSLCIKKALEDASVRPEEIDYINPHATSTPAGDLVELQGISQAIPNTENVVLNASKSMIGHSCGASSALEAVITAMAIQKGEIHPTINLDNPEIDLNFIVPKTRLKRTVKKALSNSLGFGGHNAAIVLGAYE